MFSKCIYLSLVTVSILLVSCSIYEDSITPEAQPINFPNVDQELWTYYDRFETEAARRGLDIDLRELNISGNVEFIAEEGVVGTCQYHSRTPNHVTIDESFWLRSSDLSKEYVVFHELGHCVLLRDHNDNHDDNGFCISVMHSGLTDCRSAYNNTYREYYLDELFYKNRE